MSGEKFKINADTREVEVPSSELIVAQGDHNSERFLFECPRHVDGNDLSECSEIRVQYLIIDATGKKVSENIHVVKDLTVNDETINFSWLLTKNATEVKGTLSFRVSFISFDSSGALLYSWNTAITSIIKVIEGYMHSMPEDEHYSEILETWKQEVINEVSESINQQSFSSVAFETVYSDTLLWNGEIGNREYYETKSAGTMTHMYGEVDEGYWVKVSDKVIRFEKTSPSTSSTEKIEKMSIVLRFAEDEYERVPEMVTGTDETNYAKYIICKNTIGESRACVMIAPFNNSQAHLVNGDVVKSRGTYLWVDKHNPRYVSTFTFKGDDFTESEMYEKPQLRLETIPDEVVLLSEGVVIKEIIPQCELTPVEDGVFVYAGAVTIVAGETYSVEWNGTTYSCECMSIELNGFSAVCLGNLGALGMGELTDEPFVIVGAGEDGAEVMALDGSESVTLKLSGKTVEKGIIINSSTAGSTKKFMLTVDDNGTITATEV